MKILLIPWPKQGGGPSNAILRIMKCLRCKGHIITSNIFFDWKCTLLNVGLGVHFDLLKILRYNRKVIFRVDGCFSKEIFCKQNRKWVNKYENINKRIASAIKICDHVIYQSEFSKEFVDQLCRKEYQKYSIIPNGVDLNTFAPIDRKNNIRPVIGCIGTFRDNRISAILDICKQLDFEHDLLLVGKIDSVCRKDLQEFYNNNYAKENANCNIVYVPQIICESDLVKFYQKIDCFIHPIIGDTCSNAVIESLACGVPVVLPRWCGSSYLLGKGGIAVESAPWENYRNYLGEFAESIKTVLNSKERFSLFARQQACEKFDVELVANMYESVLLR